MDDSHDVRSTNCYLQKLLATRITAESTSHAAIDPRERPPTNWDKAFPWSEAVARSDPHCYCSTKAVGEWVVTGRCLASQEECVATSIDDREYVRPCSVMTGSSSNSNVTCIANARQRSECEHRISMPPSQYMRGFCLNLNSNPT